MENQGRSGGEVMGRIRVRSGMDDGGRRGDRGSCRSPAGVPTYLEGTKKKKAHQMETITLTGGDNGGD